jgi:hypothetical protein
MEVMLRPLRRNDWAGVFKFKNCSDYLGSYFTRSGQLYTGLREEDGVDAETVARLSSAEKGIDQPLNPSSEFWNTFTIKIGNKDIFLDTSSPMDELKYLFLKNHKRVANGYGDNKPTANYVLINKESDAKEANKYNQIKRKAVKEFDKLSANDQRKALRLYGHRSDALSPELVENKLFELIEKDPQKFLDKWVDNKRRETEFLIQEGVSKNVIKRNKSEYKYGIDTIGISIDDAINYLDSAEHRDLKQIIINEVNAK